MLEITKIPASKLFVSEPNPRHFGNGPNPSNDSSWTNGNWLKSRFHFSFAEYHNSENLDFGVLRVMNDDLMQPHRGFGTHPHQDVEIITYIVQGKLTHEHSMGTKESLGRGAILFMTAGTGVSHSEFNGHDEPVRFIQTWIKPAGMGLTPNYGSYRGSLQERSNQLHHMVSNVKDTSTTTPVEVNQDVDAYAAELDAGESVTLELPKGRMAYVLCIEGGLSLGSSNKKEEEEGHCVELDKRGGAEIKGSGGTLGIKATLVEPVEGSDKEKAHVLIFTMKSESGAGRSDL